ncbi:mandelate racemase/muconate lactonizing enzyme family protein [Saccharopolyspora hordei]|uniref:L-alanine-DL-glutamate epimerase-like enolase superfamily enzyme n=1 Tax=Saccharopolyspora hordei TaxID=1838 RepID=A0A853AUS9_9PSEU|nr:enolase C-terminal domain-like protein [Saccharopolyspora hordei]NYI86404.1 L-alanine-DL-glutamate epimerase-like enolase superfamily enzyme [Saccharopolyspora hordei]
MRIIDVRAIPFAIPYRKPLHFASGHIEVADNVLVEVETEDGIVGVAEAPPRPYTYGETQASIVAVIDSLFAPAIRGASILDREPVRAKLARTVGNPTAKAAIDMAMWDAWGKAVGQPVHRLLGGYAQRLQVSHMLGFDDPAAMADEAIRMRDEFGIDSFKVKVGRLPIDRDIAVCRAIRNAVGDDAELYLDGNRGWPASEAARAVRELADLGLSRVEELCPADDVLGRRWLVGQCPVPFVADESAPTPADVTRELLAGAANAISIKTARTGFSDSLRVAHLAEGLGAEVVIGNQIDGQVGTACSLAFGASQRTTANKAAELSNYLDMADDLLTEPLRITDGAMTVLHGPGLGIEIDRKKLDYYRTDR